MATPRWMPTPSQLALLETQYASCAYPSMGQRVTLATQLGIQGRQVQVWFQNRRAKAKKEGTGAPPTSSSTDFKPVESRSPPKSHAAGLDDRGDSPVPETRAESPAPDSPPKMAPPPPPLSSMPPPPVPYGRVGTGGEQQQLKFTQEALDRTVSQALSKALLMLPMLQESAAAGGLSGSLPASVATGGALGLPITGGGLGLPLRSPPLNATADLSLRRAAAEMEMVAGPAAASLGGRPPSIDLGEPVNPLEIASLQANLNSLSQQLLRRPYAGPPAVAGDYLGGDYLGASRADSLAWSPPPSAEAAVPSTDGLAGGEAAGAPSAAPPRWHPALGRSSLKSPIDKAAGRINKSHEQWRSDAKMLGVPLTRHPASMDALEVLTSRFAKTPY